MFTEDVKLKYNFFNLIKTGLIQVIMHKIYQKDAEVECNINITVKTCIFASSIY